jgi:hypothetical protein
VQSSAPRQNRLIRAPDRALTQRGRADKRAGPAREGKSPQAADIPATNRSEPSRSRWAEHRANSRVPRPVPPRAPVSRTNDHMPAGRRGGRALNRSPVRRVGQPESGPVLGHLALALAPIDLTIGVAGDRDGSPFFAAWGSESETAPSAARSPRPQLPTRQNWPSQMAQHSWMQLSQPAARGCRLWPRR